MISIGAFVLAGLIFTIDSLTMLGSAVAVLYVTVIFLAADAARARLLATSIGCAVLTISSFLFVHGLAPETQATLRLLFSLLANLMTTIFVFRSRRVRGIVAAQARLLELSSDAIFLKDSGGKILYWSSGAEQLYGWSAPEALGRDASDLLGTSLQPAKNTGDAALVATGQAQGELRVTAKDGRELDIIARWRLQSRDRFSSPTILEIGTDITERNRAGEALKASELRFRTIFDTLAIAIWEHDFRAVKAELDALRRRGITDIAGYIAGNPDFVNKTRAMVRITDVNRTALTLMGVRSKDEFFTHLDEFLPETDASFAQGLIAIAEGHPTFQSEATIRDRNGKLINVIVVLSFPPDGAGLDRIHGSIVDITERRHMSETLERTRRELEQASRSATIGEISASIAHEVNQPLAAIITCAQAAQRWLSKTPPDIGEADAALADVVVGAERAADIVNRVRMLLGKSKSDNSELNVDFAVADAVRVKRDELALQNVQISLDLGATDVAIRGDRVLLQQALLNVINNAAQAMETMPADRRKLWIATETADDGVRILVTDSGPGFDCESPEAAFKPFWTTKAEGMGLGLAMCRSIVTAHRGQISVDNRSDDSGAAVTIFLPRFDGIGGKQMDMTG
jgi:PAS domain S-box-containing protein